MPDMNTLSNTFTVPETHKYEINITSTIDTDDKYMNTSRRCRNSKALNSSKVSIFIHWGLYFYSFIVKYLFIVQL